MSIITKIGIELETLIKLSDDFKLKDSFEIDNSKDSNSKPLHQIITELDNLNCDRIEKQDKKRNSAVKQIIRGYLTQIYKKNQNENQKIPFQMIQEAYTQPCTLDETETNNTKYWTVTPDGSVQVKQDSSDIYYTENHNIYDSSIITNPSQIIEEIEYVSPIITIDKDGNYKEQIKNAFLVINKKGLQHFHNTTTSNHLHFSFEEENGKKTNILRENPEYLFNICMFWLYFEPYFYSIVPKWRSNNKYCQSMKELIEKNYTEYIDAIFNYHTYHDVSENDNYKTIDCIIDLFQGNPKEHDSRYAGLNLLNLREHGIGTIEVRIKHGSTSVNEMINFIEFFNSFFTWVIEFSKNYNDHYKNPLLGRNILNNDYIDYIDHCSEVNIINIKNKLSDFGVTFPDKSIVPASMNTSGGTGNYQYIFSYGSNSKKQLKERIEAKIKPIPAVLANHVRIFSGYSNNWKGAIASVHPKKGDNVYGALSKITQEQLELLDNYEGGYTRKIKLINIVGSDKKIKAWVYFKDNLNFTDYPSVSYMKAIRRTLDDVNSYEGERKNIIIKKINDNGKVVSVGYYDITSKKIIKNE